MTRSINNEITVSSFYFADGRGQRSFPKQIEWNGRFVTFADSGLRMLVGQGSRLIQLFDMTDGSTQYRLRHEGNTWTLVGTL